MSQHRRTPHADDSNGRRIALVVGAVVAIGLVVVGVIAFLAVGGDDTDDGVEQTRPVQVRGGGLPPYVDGTSDPAIGQAAPTLAGQSFDGSPVRVQLGQPTLVIFLAHWCPVCQAEVPQLIAWEEAGQVPDGIDVVTVATAVERGQPNYPPSEWLDEPFPFPVLADDDDNTAASRFGLTAYPYWVLLDADGRVVARADGAEDFSTFSDRLVAALG
jgi:thiol-disulfide isomerase/thioredoxin